MEANQFAALGFLELLFLAVLGWRIYRALATPLLYLLFLVPFGSFLTPALQDFTARFIAIGLDVLGIPHFADAVTMEIPQGTYYVAEACAGLRFLIGSAAFGVLYTCLLYRSPARRAGFILAALLAPILANGLRGLGIVVLGYLLGSAQATATDHLLYGWLFFSLVIVLLTLASLPWREDHAQAAAPRSAA